MVPISSTAHGLIMLYYFWQFFLPMHWNIVICRVSYLHPPDYILFAPKFSNLTREIRSWFWVVENFMGKSGNLAKFTLIPLGPMALLFCNAPICVNCCIANLFNFKCLSSVLSWCPKATFQGITYIKFGKNYFSKWVFIKISELFWTF